VPEITFEEWVSSLPADTLEGTEKIPLVDLASSKSVTATALASFIIDKLKDAGSVSLSNSDKFVAFQSGLEKTLTAQNFFNWIVDKLEAIGTSATITSGDKLIFNDGGELRQIEIDVVRAFLSANQQSLGTQIVGLSAATLGESDQYVLAQSGVAKKTTYADIAARVYAQFLNYVLSLDSVSSLADADTFYVIDSGVSKKITALKISDYVEGKLGTSTVLSAWNSFSALPGAVNATDTFILKRSADGKTATGANIASYVVSTQNAATAAVAGASGDSFVIFRSGVQQKLDIGLLSSYVIASGWSASSGSPVTTGDKIVIGRAGSTLSVTVDELKTFTNATSQQDVLNLTVLSSATLPLSSASLVLIGDGSVAKKTTLGDLESTLWADYRAYVAGLPAHTSLVGGNTFYVIDGTTPKKTTGADLLSYVETQLWNKGDASPPVTTGDDIWMRRGSASFRLDVGSLASYLSGVIAADIDISALSAASISDGDLFLVDDGGDNKKLTYANLKANLHPTFATYVSTTLASSGTPATSDFLYLVNSAGSPFKLLISDLWTNRYLVDAKAIKLDDFYAPDDNTDLNATTSAHGLLIKAVAPSSGFRNVVAIDNGEIVYANKALFDATVPSGLGIAAAGSSMTAARRDHVHAMPKLDDVAAPDDNTDLNATSSAHGLMPKLSNNTRLFYRGDGTQATYASITASPFAADGSNSGDAVALATTNTTFITCDSATKGVRLPAGAAGDIMEVINNSSAVSARLYPASGGVLNGLATDAAVVIPANKGVRCFCSAANTWTVFEMTAKAAAV
jgi:hypothetical protein